MGKVIRITPAHHAKIEEKPEVRKAGGVYYTPTYIVDYIVKSTVGKIVGAVHRDRPGEGTGFPNNLLILAGGKPRPEVTVEHQELPDGTPFAIDIFGVVFLFNLELQPCVELNEDLRNAGFKAFPLYN